MSHYNPKHAKAADPASEHKPFRETTGYKMIALAAAAPAAVGIIATGGAVATHYTSDHHAAPGAYYGVAADDHADPNHVDPGGEWVRIEASPTIGTAATGFTILGPGD